MVWWWLGEGGIIVVVSAVVAVAVVMVVLVLVRATDHENCVRVRKRGLGNTKEVRMQKKDNKNK